MHFPNVFNREGQKSGSTHPVIASTSNPQPHMKIKLPSFSGNVLHWRDFWATFEPLIKRDFRLTDAEKISLLQEAMKDESAKRTAKIVA